MKKLYHYPAMLALSLPAVLLFLVFEIAAFVQFVVFNPALYTEAMARKSVSQAVYNDLETYFTQFSAPTGIPKEVFLDPIKEEELYDSAYLLLTDSLTYLTDKNAPKPEIQYDFAPFEDSVVGYIESYTERNGYEKDDEYYDLIDNTVSTGEGQIRHHLDVMMLYQLSNSKYGEMMHQKSWLVKAVLAVSGLLLALVAFFMVLVDRRHPRDLPYWAGMVLAVSSLILMVPAMYLNKINYFSTFFVRSQHIYLTVTGVFQTLLNKIIYCTNLLFVIGVILIVSTIVIHMIYKSYRRNKHRHH